MIKKTPLNEAHKSLGARMVEFAGWELPVQYTGPIPEHMAVREAAGLFDVSHMGELEVRGKQAVDLVDRLTVNAVRDLDDNNAHYTMFLNEQGGIIDDLLVYKVSKYHLILVVNAGTTEKDLNWVLQHAADFDCEVANTSPIYAQIAIQGPRAERILQQMTSSLLDRIPSFCHQIVELDSVRCRVSRSGYTGEDGFEIYLDGTYAPGIWNRLLVIGSDQGLLPCGLAARNTLRLESKMALYGNDIDDTTSPLEAGLGWVVKMDKGDFIGRAALEQQKRDGLRRKLVGFEMLDKAPARDGYEVVVDGTVVGRVTSGSPAPYLKKNIGLAYVPPEHASVGTGLGILVRGREVPAVVVKTPFYKRKRVFD
ncbi:MAG: glycine cleavage system aminomethyltransferase GcvT [Blastocatellia bacterium]|mgnify:CR=1 FL=1|nr:glycine cleavage system aminomethyltransferase GcvT [Blastocatellia bacterium]